MEYICGLFDSEIAAAWVQALGTIIAIGVAIWAPIHHNGVVDRRAARSEVTAAAAIAVRAYKWVIQPAEGYTATDESIANYVSNEYGNARFNDELAALRAIPLVTAKDDRIIAPVMDLIAALEKIQSAAEQVSFSQGRHGQPMTPAEQEEARFWFQGGIELAKKSRDALVKVRDSYFHRT